MAPPAGESDEHGELDEPGEPDEPRESGEPGTPDEPGEPTKRLPVWPALVTIFLHAFSVSIMVPNASPIALSAPHSLGIPVECTWQNCTDVTALDADDVKVRSQLVLSTMQSTSAAFQLVSAGILGGLCDRIGTKPVAFISQVGHIVAVGTMALCSKEDGQIPGHLYHVWRALIASHAFSGLCGHIGTPVQAYIARARAGSVRDFGKMHAMLGLAFCAGSLVTMSATLFRGEDCPRLPLFVATCASFLGLLTIGCAWPLERGLHRKLDLETSVPCLLVWRMLCAMPLGLYGFIYFVDSFSKDMLHSGVITFANKVYAWGPTRFSGFTLAAGLLSPLVLVFLMPQLLRWCGRLCVLRLGFAAMLTSLLLLFAIGLTPWGGLLYLVAVGMGFSQMLIPAMMGLAVQELPKEEVGKFSGALAVADTIAKISAPLLTGVIMKRTLKGPVPSAVFLAAGAVALPGVVLSWRIRPRGNAEGCSSDSGESGDSSGSSTDRSVQDSDVFEE